MNEHINESVSIDLLSNHLKGNAYPWTMYWRGRRYRLTQVGLHHKEKHGDVLFHIFSVTDGINFYKLKLDTETLSWKLLEIASS